MESSVFLSDLLTAHEPKMRKPMEINERIFWFMGSEHLQKLDVSWGHEPLLVSPLPALSPQGGERVVAGRERGWFMDSHFCRVLRP